MTFPKWTTFLLASDQVYSFAVACEAFTNYYNLVLVKNEDKFSSKYLLSSHIALQRNSPLSRRITLHSHSADLSVYTWIAREFLSIQHKYILTPYFLHQSCHQHLSVLMCFGHQCERISILQLPILLEKVSSPPPTCSTTPLQLFASETPFFCLSIIPILYPCCRFPNYSTTFGLIIHCVSHLINQQVLYILFATSVRLKTAVLRAHRALSSLFLLPLQPSWDALHDIVFTALYLAHAGRTFASSSRIATPSMTRPFLSRLIPADLTDLATGFSTSRFAALWCEPHNVVVSACLYAAHASPAPGEEENSKQWSPLPETLDCRRTGHRRHHFNRSFLCICFL